MKVYLLLVGGLLALFAVLVCAIDPPQLILSPKAMSIKDAFEDNFNRTKDPALGYPPVERLMVALEKTRRMQAEYAARGSRTPLSNVRFRERGPNNIGGRTRAILIDKNDPSGNTVFVGSVAGGLWKSEDITADPPNWQKVNDYLENLSIGAIAQDPSHPELMYLGTGEGFPNLDAVRGLGLFKSTDGGRNWTLLSSTVNTNFRATQDILVHPATGDIYAAASGGLLRSTNGGDNWQKVLSSNNFYNIKFASNGYMYASNTSNIYRSMTGGTGEWERLTTTASGFPSGMDRVEITISKSNPEVLYAICSDGGEGSAVFFSSTGGVTWATRGQPVNEGSNTEFTNGQAWYDLDIAVDPFNPNNAVAGGVPMMRSNDGGFSWIRFNNATHVDQHIIRYDEDRQGIVFFGNDGGIHRSTNGFNQQAANKNMGYNVTQFYAGAIHPEAFSNYILGGTQDNGSLQLNSFGVSSARNVWGGDGFYCFIDEDEPNIQIVSSQFGNWGISTNGGGSFDNGAGTNSGFIDPSDYDSESNILYTQTNDGDFYRWRVSTGQVELVDIPGASLNVSCVTVDINTPNRVYFGNGDGRIYRIDDADSDPVAPTQLAAITGTISSIDIEDGDPDHLLVTVSNYGVNSVFESNNGGQSWLSHEGDLPDMPVRWGIFNPNDSKQAMIATEAGVWVTELLNGTSTEWIPPVPGRGTPLVSTYMLRLRRSDKVVLAVTHGRGMFTTDVFSDPAARIQVEQVQYTNAGNTFYGEGSLSADTYAWEFGDGGTSTEENPTHDYAQKGTYAVKLTINDNLATQSSVKVLPDMPTPYITGRANYGGDFEGFEDQYGTETLTGSSFERGNSTVPGKNGAHSGSNAFVLGLTETFYQPNTHARLYMPNYDLTQQGIYEFSFWAKYDMQPVLDGFLVEYTLDRGKTWQTLGSNSDKNWYNYRNNQNNNQSAFPDGASYFTNLATSYTRYAINISGLSGNYIAFRFVFRSEGTGNFRGVAIDDVQVSKYEGDLATQLVSFNGERTSGTEVKLTWSTLPEYYCRKFEVERSVNGRDFETLGTVNATGVLTANVQSYSHTSLALLDLYFYRIKVINEQEPLNYSYEFYSPTIAIRRDLEGVQVRRIFPNPFTDQINLTLTDVVDQIIPYELFNAAGQLVAKGNKATGNLPFITLQVPPNLSPGVYFLRIKLGEGDEQVFNLLRRP